MQPSSDKRASRGSQAADQDDAYIKMRLVNKNIPCLVDSGSEITLVPKSVVDGLEGIEVQPSTRQIQATNGTDIAILGEVLLPFELDGRCMETIALVTADIEEVVLGFDWLKKHQCIWDFRSSTLNVDGHTAVVLSPKHSLVCRQVCVQGDVTLEPRQQLETPARMTRRRPRKRIKSKQVPAEAEEFVSRKMTANDPVVGDLIDLSEDVAVSKPESEVQVRQLSDVDENATDIGPVGDQMADLQLNDPDIGPILGWRLHHAERPAIDQLLSMSEASKMLRGQWDQFELHNGVLYRRKMGLGGKADILQLLVPACLRSEYLQRAHISVAGVHSGIQRTTNQVRRCAFWIGWRRDVQSYCRQCQNCNCCYRDQRRLLRERIGAWHRCMDA